MQTTIGICCAIPGRNQPTESSMCCDSLACEWHAALRSWMPVRYAAYRTGCECAIWAQVDSLTVSTPS